MKISVAQRVLTGLILVMFVSAASAAKPPVKNHATKGTTQLHSDYNDPCFGQTFTLGKATPINITVDRAEYSVGQVNVAGNVQLANADEKMLVLHYTLHNPNKTDFTLRWGTLEIFGVDANDKNWRFCTSVAVEGTGEDYSMSLKPGQKTHVFTAIKLPAKGALPKLVVQSGDSLVLRYNLMKKNAAGKFVNPVKPLPATIADPADPTCGTALTAVSAQIGEYYPLRELDAKLDSVEFSNESIRGKAPDNGQRYLVLKATAKNKLPGNFTYRWGSINPKLTDADGGKIDWNGTPLYASRDEDPCGDIEPGKELRVRFFFPVPEKAQLKSVSLQQTGEGRQYVYDLSNLK